MEEEIRRSSRTNKGTHSRRAEHDVYYLPDGEEPPLKKAKQSVKNIAADTNEEDAENEGKVRCDGCGMTEETYDDETDEGGIMIECEQCKTWQHAKCMGYRTEEQIPEVYLCRRCEAKNKSKPEKDDTWEIPPEKAQKLELNVEKEVQKEENKARAVPVDVASPFTPVAKPVVAAKPKIVALNPKQAQEIKTRASVSKALVNVMTKSNNSALAEAEKWAVQLEQALYSWAGSATDKRYIDKSRSIMASVKKPAVFARLILNDLTPADLTMKPVEDIDPDLKNYAEKVRQELIRRSVLTVSDDQSQRIRRTHKGEEIVETKTSQNDDEISLMSMSRRTFHGGTLLPPSTTSASVVSDSSKNGHTLYQLGDEDEEEDDETSLKDGNDDAGGSDGVSDDELDFILKAKDKRSSHSEQKRTQKGSKNATKDILKEARNGVLAHSQKQAPLLPPTMPVSFWAGEIVFPDVATFAVLADFVSCTHYVKPKDTTTASFHNRAIRVCRELMDNKKYQIEGRLDRAKADPYLAQLVKLRDLYLVKLKKEDPNYSKVYAYLLGKSKVGVLSGRAPMVKDAYLFALDHTAPSYMDFAPTGEGLYVLFSVRKNYVPVGKSILKKIQPETPSASTSSASASSTASAVANLDGILLKLEGTIAQSLGHPHLPQKPPQYAPHNNNIHPERQIQNMQTMEAMPAQLSHDQMSYLSTIVRQNPHVQSDPQALLNLLQQMHT